MKDLYTVLGVPRTAEPAEIKRAFRKLTQQYHPDKNPGDKVAEERFKDVSTAYDVLGDPARRKNYDEFGDMSLTQGFDAERARAFRSASQGRGRRPGGMGFGGSPTGSRPDAGGFDNEGHFNFPGDARGTSFDDLLSQLFGGDRVADPRGRRPPVNTRGRDVEGEVTIKFDQMLRGCISQVRIESDSGAGRNLDVRVPAGIVDGSKLRVRGQGGVGDPHGDLILTVRVSPHPRLKREGNNILMNLPVSALEAVRGGTVEVPAPSGPLRLKLKPASQNGQVLRLKGKGIAPSSGEPGDLLVTLDVRLPNTPDPELIRVLERLQGDVDVCLDVDH